MALANDATFVLSAVTAGATTGLMYRYALATPAVRQAMSQGPDRIPWELLKLMGVAGASSALAPTVAGAVFGQMVTIA